MTCRYAGEMTYQVHGAPRENKDAQKVHILSYSIMLPNYDEPLEMRIQQKITLCSVGLFACVGPWLSKTEDTRGLGQSKIARVLASYCCIVPEGMIAREIRIVLEKAGRERSSRAVAESVGFTCEAPPSMTCRYAGEMTYQVHDAPRENKDVPQRAYIVSYSIVLLNHDEPLAIRIQQNIAPVP